MIVVDSTLDYCRVIVEPWFLHYMVLLSDADLTVPFAD
jgi:hypothetical protein